MNCHVVEMDRVFSVVLRAMLIFVCFDEDELSVVFSGHMGNTGDVGVRGKLL